MNEVAIQEGTFSLSPRNLAEAMEYAKIIASSDMVPKDYINKPGNVLVAVQTGAEVGLKPMQSLQGIAVINGRPAIWGDAMWALVVSHPEFDGFRDENTDTQSTVWLKRRNQGEIMRSFSIEDAKKAGLFGKQGPWTSNPKRMMQMRARAFAARDLFPDALKGIKSVEEVRDYGAEPEKDMGPAEVVAPVVQDTRQECSVAKFEENKAAWRKLIIEGKKTVADLIATLETKTILSEEQKMTIDSWSHENE
jgi:hypothetical protein